MPTSKEYAHWAADTLAPLGDVRLRAMMGEYVLYYKNKVVGGIYDERVLVKNVPPAAALLGKAPLEIPYPGAKPMLLVEELEDILLMQNLFEALYQVLPEPRSRRSRKKQTVPGIVD